MTPEQVKEITENIKNDTSTPEEEIALLEFLNEGVDKLRAFVKDLMVEEKEEELKSKI